MKKRLHDTIYELDAELKRTEAANENVRSHIEHLKREIEDLRGHPGEVPEHRYRQFLEPLRDSVQHFETEHLSLTLAVKRVIDALTSIGL